MKETKEFLESEVFHELYNQETKEEAKKANEALRVIMGFNAIEGFPVHQLARQIISEEGRNMKYLPVSVKKAWMRMKLPMAHISDEPFGLCDANVANVKVTIHPDERNDVELAHAYASASVEGVFNAIYIPETERMTYLYKIAVGKATASALTAAGFGMGYENDSEEVDLAFHEGVKKVGIEEESELEYMVSLNNTVTENGNSEAETPLERGARATEAATAEKKLTEFRKMSNDLIELHNVVSNESYDRSIRDSSAKTLESLKGRYLNALSDLKRRADKGLRSPKNGISKVLTVEILNNEIKSLPVALRGLLGLAEEEEKSEKAEISHSEPEITPEEDVLDQLSLDLSEETVEIDTPTEPADDGIMDYTFISRDPKISGKKPGEISLELLQWVCITTSPNVESQDKEAAYKAALKLFSGEKLEKLKRRLGK